MNIFLTCRYKRAFIFSLLQVLALLLNQFAQPKFASATNEYQSPYDTRVETCFLRVLKERSVDLARITVIPAESNTGSPPAELQSSGPLIVQTQHVLETTDNAVVVDTGKTSDLANPV